MSTYQQKKGYTGIFKEVDRIISAYENENNPIYIMDRLPFSQFNTIKMCEFYSNSRYLGPTGNVDELQRDKPFYNVVNYRVTLAKVATDLDVKDIRIEADSPQYWVKAMLLQHEAYKWMKEVNFAQFLNTAGQTRAKYGGVLAKKTMVEDDEYGEQLIIDVPEWKNMVTDQIDIRRGVKIEQHFMTPVELSKKSDSWDNVPAALKAAAKRQTNKRGRGADVTGQQYNSERILVLEVKGEFPKAVLTQAQAQRDTEKTITVSPESTDWYEFSNQKYFIADIAGECFVFWAEEVEEEEYKYLPWEEMPGRGLGRGIIEDAEEAQVWTNDAVINEKNAMDLAGKVVLKTTDPKLQNNIFQVDNGKIFKLDEGKTLEALSLSPAALGEFQNQITKWEQQANFATSSFDANTGEQPPANTPYSQTALLNQVASKPFDYRREEAGIWITEMFEDWIIPFLIERLSEGHTLTSEFTDEELAIIDNSFAISKANEQTITNVIKTGTVPSQAEYDQNVQEHKSKLQKNSRSLEIPDGYFDDVECGVTVVTTNEQKDKAAMIQSLSTILDKVANSYNPQTGEFMILKNPILAKIFGSIVEMAGIDISPTNLGLDANAKAQATPAPLQLPPQQSGTPSPVPAGAPVVQ